MSPSHYPVEAAIKIAVKLLGMTPHEFWQMTPAEFYSWCRAWRLQDERAYPPTVSELDDLRRQFPDG